MANHPAREFADPLAALTANTQPSAMTAMVATPRTIRMTRMTRRRSPSSETVSASIIVCRLSDGASSA